MRVHRLCLIALVGGLAVAGCRAPEVGPLDSGPTDGDAVDMGGPADSGEALLDPGVAADDIFDVGAPDPKRVDVAALRQLIDTAKSYRSDGLLVALDDTIIVERYFDQPRGAHSVQSITKSVDGLAIGALIDSGRITSLDEPVGDFFPEWQMGEKAQVTLRNILTHTSGLVDTDAALQADDVLAYARAMPLTHTPGTTFDYSNAAVELLSGIVVKAAGMDADQLVTNTFFTPMGITNYQWTTDGAGNVDTAGGLFMTPRELLRLGRLLRDGGEWSGQRLVSANWAAESESSQIAAAPCYGLLWWLERDGCDAFQPPYGATHGYYALGYGGQYILVIPSAHLMAVRTRNPIGESQADEEATFFGEFPDLVLALAP